VNEILTKLTNLSYEFFGVILPGFVGFMFLVFWWIALGPVAPKWTWGVIPQFTVQNASSIADSLNKATGVGTAVPIVLAAYFVGHIILWIGRSGKADEASTKRPMLRVFKSLLLQIPKPVNPYDLKLQPLFEDVRLTLAAPGLTLDWRQFFPIAKSYLAKNLPSSLVAVYQNKYTLHRSLATAAAAWFWLNVAGLAGGGITRYFFGVSPRWGLHAVFAAISIVLVWGFSSSYLFHWEMFGNTLITETYAAFHEPKK
jgi:hypothetical protein